MKTKDDLLTIDYVDDITVGKFNESRILDVATVDKIRRQLDDEVKSRQVSRIVLDFEGVSYLSSAFLGYLIKLHKTLSRNGGWLRLCSISDEIAEVFRISELQSFFDIRPSRSEAMR